MTRDTERKSHICIKSYKEKLFAIDYTENQYKKPCNISRGLPTELVLQKLNTLETSSENWDILLRGKVLKETDRPIRGKSANKYPGTNTEISWSLIYYSKNIENTINRNPETGTTKTTNKFTGYETRSLYNARKIKFDLLTYNTISPSHYKTFGKGNYSPCYNARVS